MYTYEQQAFPQLSDGKKTAEPPKRERENLSIQDVADEYKFPAPTEFRAQNNSRANGENLNNIPTAALVQHSRHPTKQPTSTLTTS